MTAKTFNIGEVLSAADVNEYLTSGYWRRINRSIISSGSPVTSVTFSSLVSTYRLFRIVWSLQASADVPILRINNDTGNNYETQRFAANDTTPDPSRATLNHAQLHVWGSGANTSQGEVVVSKLATGVRAVYRGNTTVYNAAFGAGATVWYSYAGNWNNTSVLINRLDVLVASGNFYGVVALDGMQGA